MSLSFPVTGSFFFHQVINQNPKIYHVLWPFVFTNGLKLHYQIKRISKPQINI